VRGLTCGRPRALGCKFVSAACRPLSPACMRQRSLMPTTAHGTQRGRCSCSSALAAVLLHARGLRGRLPGAPRISSTPVPVRCDRGALVCGGRCAGGAVLRDLRSLRVRHPQPQGLLLVLERAAGACPCLPVASCRAASGRAIRLTSLCRRCSPLFARSRLRAAGRLMRLRARSSDPDGKPLDKRLSQTPFGGTASCSVRPRGTLRVLGTACAGQGRVRRRRLL